MQHHVDGHDRYEQQREVPEPPAIFLPKFFAPFTRLGVARLSFSNGKKVQIDPHDEENNFKKES